MGKKKSGNNSIIIEVASVYDLHFLCEEFLFKNDPHMKDNENWLEFLNEVNKNTFKPVNDRFIKCKITTKLKKEEIQMFCKNFVLSNKYILAYMEKYIK